MSLEEKKLWVKPNDLHAHGPDCRASGCIDVVAWLDYVQLRDATAPRTDTDRLDFVESYLQREGYIDDALRLKMRVWSIATAETERPLGLRETIDTMMAQRGKLQNG